LKQYWLTLSSKFEALKRRERVIVFFAVLICAVAILNAVLLAPAAARNKTLSSELSVDQTQIQSLRQQLSAYAQQGVIDPDAQNKAHLAELQTRVQELDNKLHGLQSTLVSPDKMPELLRGLLQKNGKLKLVELKTLPVTGMLDTKSTDAGGQAAASQPSGHVVSNDFPMFRHGVEITIEGRYLDLLDYVAAVEQLPWHVLWSKAGLTTDNYPRDQLILTVYTLSLDKAWLSI
jgi:MSHA biogenesis protein MshJ